MTCPPQNSIRAKAQRRPCTCPAPRCWSLRQPGLYEPSITQVRRLHAPISSGFEDLPEGLLSQQQQFLVFQNFGPFVFSSTQVESPDRSDLSDRGSHQIKIGILQIREVRCRASAIRFSLDRPENALANSPSHFLGIVGVRHEAVQLAANRFKFAER